MSEPAGLEMLRAVHDKLERGILVWEDKNEKLIRPVSVNNDYRYGYNCGVREGFRAAAGRPEAVIAKLEAEQAGGTIEPQRPTV